jgi:hypothetical protein
MTAYITYPDGTTKTFEMLDRHVADAKKFYRSMKRKGKIASWSIA